MHLNPINSLIRKTMHISKLRQDKNYKNENYRGSAVNRISGAIDEKIRAQPGLDRTQLVNTLKFAVKITTEALNNAGEIAIPIPADVNAEFLNELIENHDEDLQFVCCHRNTWLGNPDYKSNLFGTCYTDHARHLMQNSLFRQTRPISEVQQDPFFTTGVNRDVAVNRIIQALDEKIRTQPRLDRRQLVDTLKFAVEITTRALNNGGNTILPIPADVNREFLHELIERHDRELEMVCCHRHTRPGNPNHKWNLFGTSYTDHALRLLQTSYMRDPHYLEFLNNLIGAGNRNEAMEVHDAFRELQVTDPSDSLKLPSPKEWNDAKERILNGKIPEGNESRVWDLISNNQERVYIDARKNIFAAYQLIEGSDKTKEEKEELRKQLTQYIGDCAKAYDNGSMSCGGGMRERAIICHIAIKNLISPLPEKERQQRKFDDITLGVKSMGFTKKMTEVMNYLLTVEPTLKKYENESNREYVLRIIAKYCEAETVQKLSPEIQAQLEGFIKNNQKDVESFGRLWARDPNAELFESNNSASNQALSGINSNTFPLHVAPNMNDLELRAHFGNFRFHFDSDDIKLVNNLGDASKADTALDRWLDARPNVETTEREMAKRKIAEEMARIAKTEQGDSTENSRRFTLAFCAAWRQGWSHAGSFAELTPAENIIEYAIDTAKKRMVQQQQKMTSDVGNDDPLNMEHDFNRFCALAERHACCVDIDQQLKVASLHNNNNEQAMKIRKTIAGMMQSIEASPKDGRDAKYRQFVLAFLDALQIQNRGPNDDEKPADTVTYTELDTAATKAIAHVRPMVEPRFVNLV